MSLEIFRVNFPNDMCACKCCSVNVGIFINDEIEFMIETIIDITPMTSGTYCSEDCPIKSINDLWDVDAAPPNNVITIDGTVINVFIRLYTL